MSTMIIFVIVLYQRLRHINELLAEVWIYLIRAIHCGHNEDTIDEQIF